MCIYILLQWANDNLYLLHNNFICTEKKEKRKIYNYSKLHWKNIK